MSSSSVSPRSSHFCVSENTTAPSTPPPNEDETPVEDIATRHRKLDHLLETSTMFSTFLKERMEEARAKQRAEYEQLRAEKAAIGQKRKSHVLGKTASRSKRRKGDSAVLVTAGSDESDVEEPPIFAQPSLITGAKMKNYQLEGLQWMASLHQNGMSGILADEMGLGKTLQTIAFSAYLREESFFHPFMIVCPLSVLHNWVSEYQKFAPDIPVCMYHGTPEERAELRRTVMSLGSAGPAPKVQAHAHKRGATQRGKRHANQAKKSRRGDKKEDEQTDGKKEEEDEVYKGFPVVITTYEIVMKDRAHLSRYSWGYITVDEGHRLKNLDCKLVREIKQYSSAGRMILTGTPLHNNISELWALMSFVLPDMFGEVQSFQEEFDLSTIQEHLGTERSQELLDKLHGILRPFLLRRLKVDVEMKLPPKKEYVIYAPLSRDLQSDAYSHALKGTLRSYLIDLKSNYADLEKRGEPRPRKGRHGGQQKSYAVDGDDDQYFEMLAQGEVDERGIKRQGNEADLVNQSQEYRMKATLKAVNSQKLQNTVMQLRKACSHPFLFDWPLDSQTRQPILNNRIVGASGKMMILDRLLPELFRRKHKVLLFSQFRTMLDIVEDWAREMKNWNVCRIDGQTPAQERVEEMKKFQDGGDAENAPRLFLLSTRAGGLGINLVAADTVIFYDQDWNPQMDAQAQDRAHRIGQTKPVLVFRLVSRNTIETKVMERAAEKRKLEAVVIAKGKFNTPAAIVQTGSTETAAELAKSLSLLEGEKIDLVSDTTEDQGNVLSDQDLDMLLDRSPEVFTDRGVGWTSIGRGHDTSETDMNGLYQKPAFAVYQAPLNQGNDLFADTPVDEEE